MRIVRNTRLDPKAHARNEDELREGVSQMIERRRMKAVTFSVMSLAPQLLAGETISPRELKIAESILEQQLRNDDRFCPVDDGYIIVLAHTADEQARVVAQRLAAEVTMRTAAINRRKWNTGIAGYPRDADTEAVLIKIARAAVRGRRNP